jgi:cell division protein FtsB
MAWVGLRRSLRKRLGLFWAIIIAIYFLYHILTGERSLTKWLDLQNEISIRKEEVKNLRQDLDILEARVKRLRPNTLDLDYIEELALEKYALAYPAEHIIMLHKSQ